MIMPENLPVLIYCYVIRSGETYLGTRYTLQQAEEAVTQEYANRWKNLTIEKVERKVRP